MCVGVCVWSHREVTHMTASITRLPGLGVTPEVKKDLECVHSFTHSSALPPFSAPSSLALSNAVRREGNVPGGRAEEEEEEEARSLHCFATQRVIGWENEKLLMCVCVNFYSFSFPCVPFCLRIDHVHSCAHTFPRFCDVFPVSPYRTPDRSKLGSK